MWVGEFAGNNMFLTHTLSYTHTRLLRIPFSFFIISRLVAPALRSFPKAPSSRRIPKRFAQKKSQHPPTFDLHPLTIGRDARRYSPVQSGILICSACLQRFADRLAVPANLRPPLHPFQQIVAVKSADHLDIQRMAGLVRDDPSREPSAVDERHRCQ